MSTYRIASGRKFIETEVVQDFEGQEPTIMVSVGNIDDDAEMGIAIPLNAQDVGVLMNNLQCSLNEAYQLNALHGGLGMAQQIPMARCKL